MSGAERYGHRRILRIALPMMLANLSPSLVGLVDTAVIGRLGAASYLGAVAVGGTIFSFAFATLNFLRMTTTGLAAQAEGARDGARLRTILGQSVGTALALALLLLLIQQPIERIALRAIAPSAEVAALAGLYFDVRVWSAPATLVNFALIGWFIGLGESRVPLAMVLTANLLNVALDVLFVFGLGWTVDGVALASTLAEYASTLVGLVCVARALRPRAGAWHREHLSDSRALRALFGANANLFVRTVALLSTFTFLTAIGARTSDDVLAANAILVNLLFVMAFALDGFANAAEAFVGQAIGAMDRAGLELAVRRCLHWSIGIGASIAIMYAAGGPWLIHVVTTAPDVAAVALRHLPWLVAITFVCAWPFLYDGVFVGATRSAAMRNTMLAATVLVFLPVWWVSRPLGNDGLWLAFLVFMVARGAQQAFLWRRWRRSDALFTRVTAGSPTA